MGYLVRFLRVCALVLIPFIGCGDSGDEGCEVPEVNLCIGCDPCEGVACPPDGNECTREYCSGGSCRSEPATNGRSCTYDGLSGVCVEGVCGENLCEDDVCDDDDACTDEACDYVDGTCDFTPVVCNDGNQCTVDQCDPASGLCIPVPDGLPCDLLGVGDGVCSQGECVGPGLCEGVDCTSPHECTQDGTCDPADGQCIPGDNTLAGEPCGLFGVGDGVCDGAGTCVECNDTPDCGEADQCLVWICVDTSCVEEAVPDGTECDALGIGDGTCLQGICVAPPP